jgi:hypothetical protein
MKHAFKFILFLLLWKIDPATAQEYRRTAFSFNVTRAIINEVNMGFERFISLRKSIEFDGGIIFSNSFMQTIAESYTTDPLFYEHGFAARFHYKFWREKENSKWRSYLGPGLIYKHVYYNDIPVTINKTDSHGRPYTESLLQDRSRDKGGVDFLWGSVYEASKTFAFEIYYGAGVTVSSVERIDHSRYLTFQRASDQALNQSMPTYIDHSVYFRPVLEAGFKLIIRL